MGHGDLCSLVTDLLKSKVLSPQYKSLTVVVGGQKMFYTNEFHDEIKIAQ
jgi:hypothetical protein